MTLAASTLTNSQLYTILGIIAAVVLFYAISVAITRRKRARREALFEQLRQALLAKYGDPEIVTKIMTHQVWVGQTDDQLQDSMGNPADVDEKVLKTKVKQIWKYRPQGGNRYGLRITVENRLVVGWDIKD